MGFGRIYLSFPTQTEAGQTPIPEGTVPKLTAQVVHHLADATQTANG